MGDLVSGAVVGAVFAELFVVVKAAVKTTILFQSRLRSLESTLQYIKPVIKEIDSLNKLLDSPKEEMKHLHDLLKHGKILVEKSLRVNVNLYKRYRYSLKLADLDDDILKFFQIYIMVIGRDSKEVLVEVKDSRLAIRKLSLMLEDVLNNKGMRSVGAGGFGSCVVPKAPEFVVGLNVSIRQLKKQLLDRGVSLMVVSAPGGCGKTTLVETLCHDEEIKGNFKNNIFFVTVSQSPNFTVMVQNMIHHKGKDVPQIETEQHAIDQLQQLLVEIGKDPILLVLDDVWSESESILEKFWFEEVTDYKILVTSRFDLSAFGPPHKLNPLNDEDARKLFLHSATPKVGSSFRSPSLMKMTDGSVVPRDELIDEIVKRCKGSPLALTVVGKSLCGKHPKIWESTLLEWSEGSFIDTNRAIFDCLQRSLDDLDGMPVYKECFMDLGSFPEDHAIPATALIDMWIELHKLDADGVHAKRILHELAARNLVDLVATKNDESEGDGFYDDLYVRQHDLLRELAIHQNSQGLIHERKRLNLDIRGNKFPGWFTAQDEQPLNAHLLSISTDESFLSDWPHLELLAVEVLVLNFRTKSYTLPIFIKNLVRLKTLIITNNGFFPAELSNLAILGSLPNLKRIRLECIKIPSSDPSDVTLSNLQKASFFMCDLSRGMMAMPNLAEIDIAYCSELERLPTSLCNITSLRKISITSCHNLSLLPDQIGNLFNLQVLRLSSCMNLSGLPESIGRLQNLAFLDISNCFSIGELPKEIGGLCMLKELHMKGCSGLSAVPEAVVNLEQLKYVICDVQRAHLWRPHKDRLPKVTVKIVQDDITLDWLLK
ncbi:probable disease resistance protein At5g66900 isoform X1 [Punica granatum]|uniref:Probable disease resistance protein At5g66900 isoform X1 n=1 Tax=Punica granatum TaxID=22663 RepID=A0A6P8D010_PUNGR|nr:probable disease resistance protein At5g66900 isoform X1 [Punica granatum]XP_031386966.1 probable disease resistance protein At5g66900 isoform X1 [Punica granatum]XP_031386967.1 probable disease resistance protein At5g66900 isoform X1 [Punica granatum]XP_031386968.1 probable disease resistance protein At5g66900 isoform X1 [Punica granatum]